MNRSFKSIWNSALGAWVAVSEVARARGKRSRSVAVAAAVLLFAPLGAGAQSVTVTGDYSSSNPITASPWNAGSLLTVGDTATGSLSVTGGGQVTAAGMKFGNTTGGNGTLIVDGTGSVVNQTSSGSGFFAGGNAGAGAASVTVQNGGALNTASTFVGFGGATGTLTVTGTGSSWQDSYQTRIGYLGTGTFNLLNGATATTTQYSIVGQDNGGVGVANISGAGSVWSPGILLIGNGVSANPATPANGTLTLSNSGVINSSAVYLNYTNVNNATSVGTLNIGAATGSPAAAPGTLNAANLYMTGANSPGTSSANVSNLNFNHTSTDGSYVFASAISSSTVGTATINQIAGNTTLTGNSSGFNGTTNVEGGTLRVTGQLGSASSTLNVDNGTFATSGGGVVNSLNTNIGVPAGSNGSVTVSGAGSSLTASNNITVGGSGQGSLAITNGATASFPNGTFGVTGAMIIGSASGSNGTVTVDGAGSHIHAGDILAGYLAGSSGSLTISNGATVDASRLRFGGVNAGTTGGAGTLAVTGAGSTLTIASGGTFIGGSDGATASATVSNGGTVQSASDLFLGFDGSSGSLTVTGAGSSFAARNWRVGYSDTGHAPGAGVVNILNGATATVNGFDAVGLGSGSGTLNVDGAGSTLTVTSTSGYHGIYLGGGVGGGTSSGTMTLSNGGTVNTTLVTLGTSFDGTTTTTGTVNIGAAPGSAAAAPGILNSPSIVFDVGTGVLNFNHTSTDGSYAFSSAMSSTAGGTAIINQLAGNTNLTGNSSGFGGTTNITGGILRVNGTLGNATAVVNVSNGGTLGGAGTIGGNVSATSGGIVSPGNSIGTLTVNGNYTQAAGSTYLVQVDPAVNGSSDRIIVGGSASIAGGALLNVVRTGASPYALNTKYTVLTAAGGVMGTYTLTGDTRTAFVQLSDVYDANNVYLVANQVRSFAAAGLTPNQIATAGGLNTLSNASPLRNAVAFLTSDAAARAAFDQLSGEQHASAQTTLMENSRFVREAANDRLLGAFCAPGASTQTATQTSGGTGLQAARPGTCATTQDNVAWVRTFTSTGRIDSDGNARTLKRDIGGVFVGADTTLPNGWRVGGLGGYSRASLNADSGSGRTDDYHLGGYAGNQWDQTSVRLGASYTWHKLDLQRSAAFSGFMNSLSSKYDGSTAQVFGEVAQRLAAPEGKVIEPFAGLAYVNVRTDGFAESGGLAALTGASSSFNSALSTLGVRFSSQLSQQTTLHGMFGWRHAFGNVTPQSTNTLAGSQPFTVFGVPVARDVALIGLGIETQLRPNLKFSASYSGQVGGGLRDNDLKLDLLYKF